MSQPPSALPYRPGPGGWPHQPPPHQPPPHQPPTSAPAGHGRLWIGIVIGLVVAVVAGAVLVLTGIARFGSGSDVDASAVELPATLGDLQDQADAVAVRSPDNAQTRREQNGRTYRLTAERYQQAFDGAGVGVRTYATEDLEMSLTVIAVRSDSPGLFTGVVPDLADLRLSGSPSTPTVVGFGGVQCLQVPRKMIREGEQVDPEDLLTTVCRRAGADLTIYVHGASEGSAGADAMVATTNAAFDAVAGA